MGRRVQALDGFRGLAIALVLLQHYFRLDAGWVGVDIFFVLSGYLITSILRAERSQKRYWKIFYIRRATRILPAYGITLLAAALLFTMPWRILWPYYAFFGANLATYRHTDMVGPLGACWSLAVEEHFYLVWPAVVRFCRDRAVFWILLGIIVGEPALRTAMVYASSLNGKAYYLLTPFQLDGLAWGSLMSLLLSSSDQRERVKRVLKTGLPLLASGLSVVLVALRPSPSERPLLLSLAGYPLIALTCSLSLAWLILHEDGAVTKFFEWEPLRFLGKISYGLYLYHLGVEYLFWRMADKYSHIQHHLWLSFISMPSAICIAWLSYRFIEEPILDFGRRKAGAYRTLDAPVVTSP